MEPPLTRPQIGKSETAPGVFLSELRASRDVTSQIVRCVISKDRLKPCCQEPSLPEGLCTALGESLIRISDSRVPPYPAMADGSYFPVVHENHHFGT